jgi:Tol biopolymer transport system component
MKRLMLKLALPLLLLLAQGVAAEEARWVPHQARFSPDGSHLLVNVCEAFNQTYCRIWRYGLADGKWTALPFDKDRTYKWPSYSPDGKRIVFSTRFCPDRNCDLRGMRLAVMNADGTELKPVSGSVAPRIMPSFSPDGRRLIYWKIDDVMQTPRQMFGLYDVYETDLETATERRLTGFTATGVFSGPKYWRDGKRFMFSARDFLRLDASSQEVSPQRAFPAYAKKFGSNFIIVLEPNARLLEPLPLFEDRSWYIGYDISRDGKKLLYASSAATSAYGSIYVRNPMTTSDPLLVLREYGAGTAILDATFSPHADIVAVIRNLTPYGIVNPDDIELWIVNVDGSNPRKIEGVNS